MSKASFAQMNTKQKYKSARTSVCNNGKLPHIYSLVDVTSTGETLDYGCGQYFDNWHLPPNVKGFDPFNKPDYKLLDYHYNTALCSNVLNVIAEREVRREVLENLKCLADIVYITVYDGDKSGIGKEIKTRRNSYQMNRKAKEYLEEICEVFSDVTLRKGMFICK